jgi:hypothetical protein
MSASVNVILDMDNCSTMILVNFPQYHLKVDQEAMRRAEQLSCSECQGTEQNEVIHCNNDTESLWHIGASPYTWRQGFSGLLLLAKILPNHIYRNYLVAALGAGQGSK